MRAGFSVIIIYEDETDNTDAKPRKRRGAQRRRTKRNWIADSLLLATVIAVDRISNGSIDIGQLFEVLTKIAGLI